MKKNRSKIEPEVRHIVFDHDGTLTDTSGRPALWEGVEAMLEELGGEGVKLYVWTARSRFSTVEILKSLGIINRFELLSCSTDCEPKPSAEGLREILGAADPAGVLVIGDGLSDVVGAKNYGAAAIGALWGVPENNREGHAKMLAELGADDIAYSPSECLDKILKLISRRSK